MNGTRLMRAVDKISPSGAGSGAFSTTLWSVVLDAKNPNSPASSQALDYLCRTYWYPLYVYVRRRGHSPAEAEDFTQAFFAHMLEKGALRNVSQEKGKFRSFLLVALTNFLNNEYQKSRTQKRGGKIFLESWEALNAEERYRYEPTDNITPEKLYERRWAFTLVEGVLSRLRRRYEAGGMLALFNQLHPLLTAPADSDALQRAAEHLSISRSAVKVALHRLRRRFGEELRTQVAGTVAAPDLIEDEIRYLFSVVSLPDL